MKEDEDRRVGGRMRENWRGQMGMRRRRTKKIKKGRRNKMS